MALQLLNPEKLVQNRFRGQQSYQYNRAKIDELKESIASVGWHKNVLTLKHDNGTHELLYGHHRTVALIELIKEYNDALQKDPNTTKPKWLFIDKDSGERKVHYIVEPAKAYPRDKVLEAFARENSEMWGDSPDNAMMTIAQVANELNNLAEKSLDADAFNKGTGGRTSVDEKSFSRIKNNGVGASHIVAVIGDKTYSRQLIGEALTLINTDDDELKKRFNALPSITMANRMKKLLTKGVTGKGKDKKEEFFDEKTQAAVFEMAEKHNLSRPDIEAAAKVLETHGTNPDPVKAIKEVVESKKAETTDGKAEEKSVRKNQADFVYEGLKALHARVTKAPAGSFRRDHMKPWNDLMKKIAKGIQENVEAGEKQEADEEAASLLEGE